MRKTTVFTITFLFLAPSAWGSEDFAAPIDESEPEEYSMSDGNYARNETFGGDSFFDEAESFLGYGATNYYGAGEQLSNSYLLLGARASYTEETDLTVEYNVSFGKSQFQKTEDKFTIMGGGVKAGIPLMITPSEDSPLSGGGAISLQSLNASNSSGDLAFEGHTFITFSLYAELSFQWDDLNLTIEQQHGHTYGKLKANSESGTVNDASTSRLETRVFYKMLGFGFFREQSWQYIKDKGTSSVQSDYVTLNYRHSFE